jgi:hypothetical protein
MITNRDNYTMSAETKSKIISDLDALLTRDRTLESELQLLPPAMIAVWTDSWLKENYGSQVTNAGNLSDSMLIGRNKFMPMTFADIAIGESDPLIDDALEDILSEQVKVPTTRVPSIPTIRNTIMFGRGLDTDQQENVFTTNDNREILFSVGTDSITRGNEMFTSVDFGDTTFSIPTSNAMIEFNPQAIDLVVARVDKSIRTTGDLAADNPRIFMGADGRRSIDATRLKANPEEIPATIAREEVQTARDIVASLENAGILINTNGIYSIRDTTEFLPPDPINGQRYSERAFLDDRAYNPGIKMQYLRALATPEIEEVEELVGAYERVRGEEVGAIPDETGILNPFKRGRLGRTVVTQPDPTDYLFGSGFGDPEEQFVRFSESLQRPKYRVQIGTARPDGRITQLTNPPVFPELLTEVGQFFDNIGESIAEFITKKDLGSTEEIRNATLREGDDPRTGGLTMDSYIPYLDMTIREAVDLSRRVD